MVAIANRKLFYLVSILSLISIFPQAGFTNNENWAELKKIENTIESLGTPVYWASEHRLCTEGLLGAYIPKEDAIYICQENHNRDFLELLGTLKHEGWHAVQKKCQKDLAVLTDAQIRSHLKIRDRKNLHSYHPKNKRAEAEARVIEQIPTIPWIKGVRELCRN